MSEPFAQYPFAQHPVPEPPRRPRGRQALGLAATAAVALAVGAGAGITLSHGSSPAGGTTAGSGSMPSASQIASRVGPALVDVTSTLGYRHAKAAGTGIVLTPDGEVLTNNHVISGATSVSVTDVGNGKTYKATVAGYDESHDVAVLRLSGASGLATATTGDSSTVKPGDNVVALGNAGGAGGTPAVASGQVTALNQSIAAADSSAGTTENLTGMIQTNADIQSGDSGGPLVNTRGQVIGLDTAASSSYRLGGNGGFGGSGDFGSQGGQPTATRGYSIPINAALSIASQIAGGHGSSTVHIGPTAFLGLEISNSGSPFGPGVLLAGAVPGTAAAKAGLTQGDTVTTVAGQRVSSSADIQRILVGHHPGEAIGIGWTDAYGQPHTATVTPASGPAA